MHDCMIGEKEFPVEGSQMANYLQLMNLKQIKAVYRRELQEKLLDWFAAHPDHPEAEHFLQQIDCREMAEEHMGEMAKILAGLDHYQELYELISIYGMEKVDLSILVHMCSTLLTEEDREEDKKRYNLITSECLICSLAKYLHFVGEHSLRYNRNCISRRIDDNSSRRQK